MKNRNVVVKKGCHSQTLLSGIHTLDTKIIYRLGVSPTGAASKPWNGCHKVEKLSGSHPTYKEEALNKGTFRAPLRSGFTLIELLVVVLIIGILAAVAVPQYQKAVAKSRFAALKLLAKAVKDAEEIFFDANGTYGALADLDVQAPQGVSLTVGNTNGHDFVRASGTNLKNRYTLYFNHSENFAGNVYCEAEQDNAVANAVCTADQGVDTKLVQDGHKLYLMSGNSTGSFPYKLESTTHPDGVPYFTDYVYSSGTQTVVVHDKAAYYEVDGVKYANQHGGPEGSKSFAEFCETYPFVEACNN